MFEEDLDAFFSEDEHAVAGTYDGATAVSVIFDYEYMLAHDMVATVNPAVQGKATVFPAAAVTKSLLVNGVTYTIRDRQPIDDGAIVRLQLEKQ